MRFLIVEDLKHKADELTLFIENNYKDSSITTRTSYQSGLEEILVNSNLYDVILLDMSMQNYDISQNEYGGDPINLAGKFILEKMYYEELETKVIVVTMYGNFLDDKVSLRDLDLNLRQEYPDNYVGSVFFSSSEEKWKDDLSFMIKKASND